ncbi:MAG: ATP-binding protein [Thermoplasmatota archaeon]
MPNVREVLTERNPWWKGPFRPDYRERAIDPQIRKVQSRRQIIALTGLRRVGKTTLLLRMVDEALRSGRDASRIVYFSFDEFPAIDVRGVIREYEALMGCDITEGAYLLLLDEIQKLDGWENQIKALYDARPNLKIVLSGSESLFIRKRTRETLGGRIFEFKVEPLTFAEYLDFRGLKYRPVALFEKELLRAFEEFVRTQGFPELVGETDRDVIRKYIRESIVEKIVYRDMPRTFRIRDVGLLEALVNILMEEPGQIVQIADLASDLKVSRKTLSNYLTYLEQSFLVRKLYNFAAGRRKVERKLKKYYPTIISPDLTWRADDASRARVLEWVVVMQLQAEYFWRDPYQHEVDVVLLEDGVIPIEVKSGKVSLDGLSAFFRKHQAANGFVITFDQRDRRDAGGHPVSLVPAYQFLVES